MDNLLPNTSGIRPLSSDLQAVAINELNEDPQKILEILNALRTWIEERTYLHVRTDDQWLIAFLRGSKFNLEKAKQKIDNFHTLKSTIPEIFNERRIVDDPTVLQIIRAGIILQISLPDTEASPCVTIIRAGSYDTDKFKFADILRVGTMFGDIMTLEDDHSIVCGYIEIMDMAHVTGAHFFQLKPDLLKKLYVFTEKALPIRQRGTAFINVPSAFEKFFNTLKTILPVKALKRVSVNSDPFAIFNYISRAYLPIEYGGENGPIQDIIDRMETKLMKYRDYFIEEQNIGNNDEIHKEQNISNESTNIFGVNGSFTKLNVD